MEVVDPNKPIEGTINEPGFINDTPSDIDAFIMEHGIKKDTYVCSIRRKPLEGSEMEEWMPSNTKGTYPDVNDIGKRWGPGRYKYVFSWRTTGPDGKRHSTMKEYSVVLGEHWNDIHDEYMSQLWRAKKQKIENEKMRTDYKRAVNGEEFNGNQADPVQAGLSHIKESVSMLRDIGLPVGAGAGAVANQDTNNMFQVMLAMQQKSNETMMVMQNENTKNLMTLVTAILQTNKPQDNNDIFKDIIHMVQNTVDLKNVLNPEKQTVVDKIFTLMESALPAIMAIAQKPKAERLADPLVGMAANSDLMAQAKNDPEILKECIRKWDETHGKEDTDVILETVGLRRPGEVYHTEAGQEIPVANHEPINENINPLTGEQAGEGMGEAP
jgi:hypothetical protein